MSDTLQYGLFLGRVDIDAPVLIIEFTLQLDFQVLAVEVHILCGEFLFLDPSVGIHFRINKAINSLHLRSEVASAKVAVLPLFALPFFALK